MAEDGTIPRPGAGAAAAPAAPAPGSAPRSGTAPSRALLVPAVLFLLAFFVAPLVDNSLFSVGEHGNAATNYSKLLLDPYYQKVSLTTIVLSLGVTFVCLLIGYPIAYFLVRYAGRWSGLVIFLLVAPLLTSVVMRSFGWQVILGRRGLLNTLLLDLGWIERPLQMLNSLGAVTVGLVHVLVPFMVLSIASVLQGVDRRLEESARILGAGRATTFARITLPLSLDGIGTGSILVFMIANGSFVTILLLGPGAAQTLPLLIYQQFTTTRDFGMAAAMSNVLLVLALGSLYLQLHLLKRRGGPN